MSTFFAGLLIAHVLFGLMGTIGSFRLTFMLIKEAADVRVLRFVSLSSFCAFVASWFTGGWYYWKYYGAAVKPVIVGGEFPWAHLVFMEAKEHIFLFLPFASLVLALLIWLKGDTFSTNPILRKKVMALALAVTILAIIVTVSGVLITGGAR